jgi:branched-subunit amino acid transport protein AzlD
LHRETVLMWCIGTTFGAAMITLLVAMCLAEVSIHRNTSDAAVQPPPLTSSR